MNRLLLRMPVRELMTFHEEAYQVVRIESFNDNRGQV